MILSWGKIQRMRALMSGVARRCAATLALTMILFTSALAQDQPQEIHAVTLVAPPFVMKRGDVLTGFCVDLWNEIAACLKIRTTYQVAATAPALLDVMQAKGADVLAAPIFYSTERDQKYDFSHPILEAGMQVLVRGAGDNVESTPLKDVLALLFSQSALVWLGVACSSSSSRPM